MKRRFGVVRLFSLVALAISLIGCVVGVLTQRLKAQDKQQAESDKLRTEALAAQAAGDESLHAWMKANKDRVSTDWIERLADRGVDERDEKLEKLALFLAEDKGDEQCLANVYVGAGEYYRKAGNNSAAMSFYAKALSLFKKLQNPLGQAKAFLGEGEVYRITGEGQKALEFFNEALLIERGANNRRGEAKALNGMGAVYYGLADQQKALDCYNQALAIHREVGDKASEADTLSDMGAAYSALGEQQKALEFLVQSLSIRRAIGDHAGEAKTLQNLGIAYFRLGQWLKAVDYWNQALPVFRSVGDQVHEGGTLSNIGAAYSSLGEVQKALDYFKQALAIRRAIGDRPGEAGTISNIGLAYYNLSEHQKALEAYAEALPIFRAVGDRAGEATTLYNIAAANTHLGEHQKALDYFEQALAIQRGIGDRGGEARTLLGMGAVYTWLGEQQKALEYLNQALAITRSIGSKDLEAATLLDIGVAYYHLKEFQKALDYFNQVLPIERSIGYRPVEAQTLDKIGVALNDLGKHQEALEYLNQALPIERSIDDRAAEAETLNNIGAAFSDLGKHQKALEYLNQALPIERAAGERALEAETSRNVMQQWNALSKPRLATLYGKHAVDLCQQLRSSIAGLDKETQQAYLKTVEETYHELADILAGQGRLWEAQQVLGLLKEEEYFEFVRRDAATAKQLQQRADLTPTEKTALERYEAVADKVASIGRRVEELRAIRSRTEEQEAEVRRLKDDLTVAGKAFQVALRQIEDDLGGNRGARDVVEELRATKGLGVDLRSLGGDIVVLSTVVSDKAVWVILTTPTTQVAGKTGITAADLNRKALAFREALLDPEVDPRPLARQFYDILIKPVEKELADAAPRTVAWMLDGSLRYLPVAALYDGKHYLVERFANVELTLASRSRLTAQSGATWRALGLGVSEAHEGFGGLPAVADELRAVVHEEGSQGGESGVLPGRRLLNREFTRQALEASREAGYQVVHIASHFAFRPGNATDSYLLLGDGSHLTVEDIREEGEPLFAGVDLLTLSACDTAMGGEEADGREVEGLGVEAQNQGAQAVLATLWPVVDESTAELMRDFYRGRQEQKLSKAEALRQAQLTLLQGRGAASRQGSGGAHNPNIDGTQAQGNARRFPVDSTKPYAHPSYWAPFILMGNWR